MITVNQTPQYSPVTPGKSLPSCAGPSVATNHRRSATPRMSPSLRSTRNNYRYSTSFTTPQRRRHPSGSTPRRSGGKTCGDRFIPNRSRLSKTSSLWKIREEASCSDGTGDSRQHQEYKDQLRRVLFGREEESPSMLGFQGSASTNNVGKRDVVGEAARACSTRTPFPFTRDFLRPFDATVSKASKSVRKVNTKLGMILDAPGVSRNVDWNVLSIQPNLLALALNGTVSIGAFNDERTAGAVRGIGVIGADDQFEAVSSTQWNQMYGNLLAVGERSSLTIWDINDGSKLRTLGCHKGFVTSMTWRGQHELLAASNAGIRRYDFRLRPACVQIYRTSQPASTVTALHWDESVLLAASGNTVDYWDPRHSKACIRSLSHQGVKDLDVCPQNSDILTSAGADGLRFWNIQSGKLRAAINTPENADNVMWSPYRTEVLASYGSTLSVWSVVSSESRQHPLAAWDSFEHGQILSLQKGRSSDVFSLHAEGCIFQWDPFGRPEKLDLDGDGFLQSAPTIR